MYRLTNPNPENPAYHGETRVVDSPTPHLTPPGTTRAHNGSAIPTDVDAALSARLDALMAAGWRFDPVGEVAYQATGYDAATRGSVVITGAFLEDCVRLAEQKQAEIAHKIAIGWNK